MYPRKKRVYSSSESKISRRLFAGFSQERRDHFDTKIDTKSKLLSKSSNMVESILLLLNVAFKKAVLLRL